jgi:hemerythrin
MDIFKWRVAYRVGDNDVDEQHRQIFQMLAELHRDIHRGDARDHIRVCLKRLLSYTQSHFGTEEALMKWVG